MDKTKSAYELSQNIYDGVLTQDNFWAKLYIKTFWSGVDDREVAEKLLAKIPDDFQGNLLDVPVGTAVFTEKKWKKLEQAQITCLDYSEAMLTEGKKKLGDQTHITFLQGDVGQLPLQSESQDIVQSMNGFHAFPDKIKAYDEIYRVLKPSGVFLASFYICGECKKTDWLVKTILSKGGWFSPPFQSFDEVKAQLEGQYQDISMNKEGAMLYFSAVK